MTWAKWTLLSSNAILFSILPELKGQPQLLGFCRAPWKPWHPKSLSSLLVFPIKLPWVNVSCYSPLIAMLGWAVKFSPLWCWSFSHNIMWQLYRERWFWNYQLVPFLFCFVGSVLFATRSHIVTQAGIHSIVKADLRCESMPRGQSALPLCFSVLHLSSVNKAASSFMHEKTDFALWNKALPQFQSVKWNQLRSLNGTWW